MKVILLQDVANVGLKFDVAEVPKGHALNMLIPSGKALPATKENLKRLESRTKKAAADKEVLEATFAKVVDDIAGSTQTVTMEANEKGHLYEGLKAPEVAAALNEAGFAVTSEQVNLNTPIKETGEHTITLAYGDVTTTFTLNIVAK